MTKKKLFLGLGSIVMAAAPVATVIACGNVVTADGKMDSSETAPAGYHYEKIPHHDHFHKVLVKDGQTAADIQKLNFYDDSTHEIPDDAFVNAGASTWHDEAPHGLPSTITGIGANAFTNADLTLLTGFNIDSVTNVEEDAFDGAILPAGFKIPAHIKGIGEAFKKAKIIDSTGLPVPFNPTDPANIKTK